MRNYPALCGLSLALLAFICRPDLRGDELGTTEQVGQILARFEQGDPGWKLRMTSLVEIARLGPGAVPALIGRLRDGPPASREFAVQALGIFSDSRAREALNQALHDADEPAPIRIYAIKALRMLGKLDAEQYTHFTSDFERGVRGTMSGALEWGGQIDVGGIRGELAHYDLAEIDSAEEGRLAPDFALQSFSGETIRLSSFRGKHNVVLRYFKLDY